MDVYAPRTLTLPLVVHFSEKFSICPWQIYGRFVVLSGFVTSPKRKNKEGECYIDGCRVYVDYMIGGKIVAKMDIIYCSVRLSSRRGGDDT